jgi:aspartate carbamoyltransferase regulatory subunit
MEGLETRDRLLVRRIESGTVVDHISAWKSDLVVKVLKLDRLRVEGQTTSVVILQNVTSGRIGRKDIIKLDGLYIDESEADIICLVQPTATINFIRDWKATKYVPKVPDTIEGKIRCPELQCISNAKREPVTTRFRTLKEERLLQCHYCDSLLEFGKIPDHVRY